MYRKKYIDDDDDNDGKIGDVVLCCVVLHCVFIYYVYVLYIDDKDELE